MAPIEKGLLALALIAGLAARASADWLVTRDGSKVETRGGWTVRGAQVLFKQPNGTLSVLRLAEVDLEASAAATAKAEASLIAPAPTPPPVRPPVLRLTEADLPPVDEENETGDKTAATPDAAKPQDPLTVSSWDSVSLPGGAGLEIFGTVTNQGNALVTAGTVAVTLYDADGGILVTEAAQLATSALPPGGSSTFRAQFPGLLSFAQAKFAVASQGYRTFGPATRAGEEAQPATSEPPPVPTPAPEGAN
jgi:hypothetical protein